LAIEESFRMDDIKMYRKIKLYAGMTSEYEIISTNAPDELIMQQMVATMQSDGADPYGMIEEAGYTVNVLGCQDDYDDGEIVVNKEFDYYRIVDNEGI